MKKLLLVVVAALAFAPTAQAGCWATVKLSSLPTGKSTWNVRVTPLQHGRTILVNAKPRVEIRTGKGTWIRYQARPTKTAGTYLARVIFPTPGRWQIRVWDGFEPHCASYHTYRAVTIGV